MSEFEQAESEIRTLCLQPCGLVGIGLLGTAIGQRLLAAGIDVVGFDIDAKRRVDFENLGGRVVADSIEVFRLCDTIILSLPNSHVVDELFQQLRNFSNWPGPASPRKVILDTTTGDPNSTERMASDMHERGIAYLDTTVVGSSEQMRRGEATLLVGGASELVNELTSIFGALSPHVIPTGPVGSAARMKLVVNLAIGLNRAVMAEALLLAKIQGLDLRLALAAMKGSPAYSRMMDSKGEKMLTGDFSPQARLAQHLKDVRLMQEIARTAEKSLPLTELHQRLLEHLVDKGYGDMDNSIIIRAFLE